RGAGDAALHRGARARLVDPDGRDPRGGEGAAMTVRRERGGRMEKRFRRPARVLLTAGVAGLAAAVAVSVAAARPAARQACTQGGQITLGLPGIPPVFLGVRPYTADKQGIYAK